MLFLPFAAALIGTVFTPMAPIFAGEIEGKKKSSPSPSPTSPQEQALHITPADSQTYPTASPSNPPTSQTGPAASLPNPPTSQTAPAASPTNPAVQEKTPDLNDLPTDKNLEQSLSIAFQEANKAFQARHYASTLKSLEKSLSQLNGTTLNLNPSHCYKLSRLFLLKANTQRIVRQYQEALKSYDDCLALAPTNIEALTFKGFSLCRLNRPSEACQYLEKALALLNNERQEAAEQENRPTPLLQTGEIKETTSLPQTDEIKTLNPSQAPTLSYRKQLKALVSEALTELKGLSRKNLTKVDELIQPITAIVPGDHFILYGTTAPQALQQYSTLAEAFYHFVDSNLIRLQGDYPAGVFLFRDKYEARKFLQSRLNFQKHVLGAFLSDRNLIVCYQDNDIGIFLHELSHKLLFGLSNLEYWAEEGIPASFERAYGYYQESGEPYTKKLVLKFGYPELPEFKFDLRQYTQSIAGLRSHFANPPKPPALSDIVKLSPHTNADYQTLQRFVACFLIENKLLPNYLDLTLKRDKKGYSSYVEAAFNRSFAHLDKRFENWINPYYTKGSKERAAISALPASSISGNKKEFESLELK